MSRKSVPMDHYSGIRKHSFSPRPARSTPDININYHGHGDQQLINQEIDIDDKPNINLNNEVDIKEEIYRIESVGAVKGENDKETYMGDKDREITNLKAEVVNLKATNKHMDNKLRLIAQWCGAAITVSTEDTDLQIKILKKDKMLGYTLKHTTEGLSTKRRG